MRFSRHRFVLALVLAIPLLTPAGHAAESSNSIKALAKWALKHVVTDGTSLAKIEKELAEMVGKVGREVTEEMVKKGGKGTLAVVRRMGANAPDAARLIARNGEQGKLLLEQGGEATIRVYKEFGDDGIRILAREGVEDGARLLKTYGNSLLAKPLSKESLAHLRNLEPEIASLSPAQHQGFMRSLARGGNSFVNDVIKKLNDLSPSSKVVLASIPPGWYATWKFMDIADESADEVFKKLPDPNQPVSWLAFWTPFAIFPVIVLGFALCFLIWLRHRRLSLKLKPAKAANASQANNQSG